MNSGFTGTMVSVSVVDSSLSLPGPLTRPLKSSLGLFMKNHAFTIQHCCRGIKAIPCTSLEAMQAFWSCSIFWETSVSKYLRKSIPGPLVRPLPGPNLTLGFDTGHMSTQILTWCCWISRWSLSGTGYGGGTSPLSSFSWVRSTTADILFMPAGLDRLWIQVWGNPLFEFKLGEILVCHQ
jgi:hypothetical protein